MSRSASSTVFSAEPGEPAQGEKRYLPGVGNGWMVNIGYFFKDTMFNSRGRGGLHINAGRVLPLPLLGRFGLWVGAGAFHASGTLTTVATDQQRYRTTFDADTLYADVGVITPWVPFPVCVVVYWHSTALRNVGLTGPLAGATLTGDHSGLGLGFDVHLLFEHFWGKARKPPRGLGLVVGYVGLLEPAGRNLVTRDQAGNSATVKKWKPLRGESLRVGLEYEF